MAQLGGQRGAARRSTAPRTLHILMATLDVSDIELARRLQLSRQAVHARRTGRTAMTADDLAAVAEALEVDPAILLGPPHEAVRWLVEHQPDRLDAVESPGVRHGELSKAIDQHRCTAPRLTFLTHRSRMDYDRGAVVRAA